jgi:cytoskeletal protein CcmA (bactofilin family)
MENDLNAQQDVEVSANQLEVTELVALSLDTTTEFEAWLNNLSSRQPLNSRQSQVDRIDHPPADFVVECEEGTHCQISFEGVLHLAGLLTGGIQSETGTLVAGLGIIEGDISVGGAVFIEGSVSGNILAPERVVLHPGARVWGDITSPSLSVRPGALFQGDCTTQENLARRLIDSAAEPAGELTEQRQEQFQTRAAGGNTLGGAAPGSLVSQRE